MITAIDAEKLAQTTIEKYVSACGCENAVDIANVLMKMVSTCGLSMCATVGQTEAVQRLQGTTDYVAKTEAGKHWNTARLHVARADCWCGPEIDYTDPETGISVLLHKRIQ